MLPQGSVYNVLNIVHDLEKGCRLHKKKKKIGVLIHLYIYWIFPSPSLIALLMPRMLEMNTVISVMSCVDKH